MKLNKEDIFKVISQYNFWIKNNTINRVSEFYKIHGYGNYDQGKIAVERIVNTDTIVKDTYLQNIQKNKRKNTKKTFLII